MQTRTEHDPLGEKEVPADAYYGIETARARENFPISGQYAPGEFIRASALVKRAAAEANMALGLLPERVGNAIVQAAQEIRDGKLHDQFLVDVFQAGAGTSHNMNTNEVIANRAVEILGGQKGEYRLVHPHDHVNMAQSTNDVIPSAIKLATLTLIDRLLPALRELEDALAGKAAEFDGIVKSGRTHLQDAVPIRLGQEFGAYAAAVGKRARQIEATRAGLGELNLGATAAGTGMNSHPRYRFVVVERLRALTGFDLRPAANLVEVTQSMAPLADTSGALRALALELIRIANDFRLLSSGPRTGLAEIVLPPVQPGSSIMPGKVNPVLAEMLNMVCFQVVGNDLTVAMAVQAGQLELNVMMPIIGHNVLQSLEILANATRVFTTRCVAGTRANAERCAQWSAQSLGLATALSPHIGYEAAAKLAQEALASGRTVPDLVREKGLLSAEDLERILDPLAMTEPGIPGKA